MPEETVTQPCARCGWAYPPELLNPMVGSLVQGAVCGICALEMINAIHGTKRTELRGQAEELRLDAEMWREDHPGCRPPAQVLP